MAAFIKDPQATLDYSVDWRDVAGATGIVESMWHVAPVEAEGLRVVAHGQSGTESFATLAGGIAGRVYRATNQVRFPDGRCDARALAVRVEAR